MNKKIYLLFGLLLALFACNKGSIDLSKQENTLEGYQIEGLYDITLSSSSRSGSEMGAEKLRLNILSDSALSGKLSISIEGVPENVTATFSATEGMVPYTTELVFALNGVPKPGKYPLKIKLSNGHEAEKVYGMNLTIPIVNFNITNSKGDIHDDIFIYNDGPTLDALSLLVNSSGLSDEVALSFENLPPEVSATFSDNHKSGSFYSSVQFIANKVISGKYPISLIATSNSGVQEQYNMNLVIEDDCTTEIASTKYNYLRYEDGVLVDSFFKDVRVVKVASRFNLINISLRTDPDNQYYGLSLQFNCNNNTVAVRPDVYIANKPVNLEGTGTYNPITKEINIDALINGMKRTQIRLVQQ